MAMHRIAVMPMDGIGREAIPAVVRVLRAAVGGFRLEMTDFDWSARTSPETGGPIVPKEIFAGTLVSCRLPNS
jgi:tartrate dehydrogenase/decarboxylase / D-malate dehydrogenase